jgi:hypothetical protein
LELRPDWEVSPRTNTLAYSSDVTNRKSFIPLKLVADVTDLYKLTTVTKQANHTDSGFSILLRCVIN